MELLKEKTSFFCSLRKGEYFIQYEEKSQAIVGVFEGDISVEDILSFWEELRNGYPIPQDIKGVAMDFTNARMDFDASEHEQIASYFLENISFVNRFRIGFVANNPHNIVIVMLVSRESYRYEVRPFTTLAASLIWIKN